MSSFVFKQPVSEEIFETKYMLHGEETVEEVLRGVAKEVASAEEVDKGFWEDTFYDLLVEGKFMPAGRILANARVDSPMKNYMNCYVLPLGDSMEEIYTTIRNNALIAKAGGGCGQSVTRLRPKGASISKGGESSGPLSFLEVFNTSAKAIHTGGNRRAANIAILDIDHPDIEEFITYKQGDGNKKLTQFNISVGITDKYIEAVRDDLDWDLQFEGKVYKTVKARYLYDLMTKNMFEHNEPGVFFLDTVNRNNNGCYMYDIESPNPCVTGDTIIAVADGRNGVAISELTGKGEFPVYSARQAKNNSNTWVTEVKTATAFKTGTKRVLRITLSDGSSFKCTPDHLLALAGKGYIEAGNSLGEELGKFYTFSNKNTDKSYRHINSKSNGYARQYRMMWEYYYGEYGAGHNVDHIDFDSTNDSIENLELVTTEEHKKRTRGRWLMGNNPINKMDKDRFDILIRQKNILANATRYDWSEERTKKALDTLPPLPETQDINIYLDDKVFVAKIEEAGIEDVYDLTVQDDHNYYIITKTDDTRYLNSSGVLIHNCSEQPLPPMGVCCLGSLKLSSFVLNPYTDEAEFDWQEYRRAIHTSVRFLDNVLFVAEYPLPEIRERALAERRIGLGFTALADTFAMLGMRYGDDESLEFAERVGRELRDYSYTASIDLAEEKGHFSAYSDRIFESEFIQKLPAKIQDRIKQSGIRNIALNTVAPAGTISLSLGNNCSSGIEPIFATEYTRNVTQLDGSKIPQTVFNEAWLDYQTITGKTEVPDFFVTSAELPLEAHLKMQAVFQQYIDASISKTIQLPDEFSLDEYKNLILDAWSMGLKGITTFNPKGSLAPILTTEKVQKPIGNGRLAKKRPEKLPCDIHEMTVNKQRMVVLVGKDEETGQLYEVFVTADPENKLYFDKAKEGFIKKTRRGRYDLVTNGHILLENITEVFDNDYASMCRLVSLAMRHNIPLQFIVDQLNKTSRFDAFSKTMARVLKKYLNDGEKALTESTCPECGEEVIFVEGCKTCRSCGWSKC